MPNNDTDLEEFDDHYSNDEEILEIPKAVRKISTQAYDKSVADIVRMIEDDDINLNPEYQRNYVWDNKKASMLIESIILNVPIPVVYVSQEEDDSWTVIDGLQRLNSLKRFFDRDFKLSGLEILSDLNKSDAKSLNPKALRILKNGLLRIIVISHDSNEEIKYDVFMRLNRGSVKLNEQELRNCLYRGTFNEMLKTLAENPQFLALLKLSEPHVRMMDCELILRYITLSQTWDPKEELIPSYTGRMKNFLNEYMLENQNPSKKELTAYADDFNDTVNKVFTVFGDKAFRRINDDGNYETTLNRSIMDVLMVSFKYFSLSKLETKQVKIARRFKELITKDQLFKDSITIGTSDKNVIAYRLNRWFSELDSIINDPN
ncbi:MAG: DUF262 domain-containing protein [Bacteroidota bacterium]